MTNPVYLQLRMYSMTIPHEWVLAHDVQIKFDVHSLQEGVLSPLKHFQLKIPY